MVLNVRLKYHLKLHNCFTISAIKNQVSAKTVRFEIGIAILVDLKSADCTLLITISLLTFETFGAACFTARKMAGGGTLMALGVLLTK